jgi:hypothetical protein
MKFDRWLLFAAGIACFLPDTLKAAAPPPPLQDPFLDRFVGDWKVERKFPGGRTAEQTLHVDWVLGHHFIEMYYGWREDSPPYEAIIFIGYDDAQKNYVCHWLDVFGARDSSLGRGRIDDRMLSIEFRFAGGNGELTNQFRFDPQAKTWTSIIRRQEKGEWKTFAEEKWRSIPPN